MAATATENPETRTAASADGRPKRLLMLSTASPFPTTNGYAMRLAALLECLALEGCETDVMCFGEGASDGHRNIEFVPHPAISMTGRLSLLRRLAALVSPFPYAAARGRSREMEKRVAARLGRYDAILCEETNLLRNLPARLPVPLILDHHNAEYLLISRYARRQRSPFRAAYAHLEALKTRQWERKACRRAQIVLTCSDHDRSLFERMAPGARVIAAPNVIDVARYPKSGGDDGRTVLYTGGMDWLPNRDAVEFFASEVLPELRRRVPGARFVIAGRGPTDRFRARFRRSPDVVFTGALSDIRPEIARAAVFVVPLRIGSGTRLKILEAAAMGKAIVSTPVGAEGLDFEHGRDILIARTATEVLSATIAALEDPALRGSLGEAARARVTERYGYPALRRSLRAALHTLALTGQGAES